MNRPRTALVVGLSLASVLLAGCAAPDNDLAVEAGAQPPGFWLGLWHGIIAPITLIISWFSDTVGIYAVRNRGGWYDFGFMLGVSIVFGGSRGPGAYRGRRRPRRSEND
ncbi:MAG: hypothetical protein JNL54_02425 [Kineosporiaceae bacterium]|nr:hypothetical protein [Kineosporiaceae bacterium]